MSIKTVYLVRHGEAENNISDDAPYKGGESSLTAVGHAQALEIAKRVKNLKVDVLIASPMKRAQQTAGYIASETGLSIQTDGMFCERLSPSRLLGLSKSSDEFKRDVKSWENCFLHESDRFEDGENFPDIRKRAADALTHLVQRTEENIVVVTHGFFLKMVVSKTLLNDSLTAAQFGDLIWAMRTTNSGLTVLKYNPEDKHRSWWLHVWNDHAHLG